MKFKKANPLMSPFAKGGHKGILLMLLCFGFISTIKAALPEYRFILIDMDAASAATAGARVSHFNADMTAFSNPAYAPAFQKRSVYTSYNKWIAGIKTGSFYFVCPRSKAGIDIKWLYDSQTSYNDSGVRTGDFSNSARSVRIFTGRRALSFLDAGIALNVIERNLAGSVSRIFCGDAGIRLPLSKLEFAAAAANIGSSSLPLTFKLSAGAVIISDILKSACEIELIRGAENILKIGAEYKISGDFSVYAGYRRRKTIMDSDGFSAGFGLKSGRTLFHYSMAPMGELGVAHRVTAGVGF